MCTSPAPCTKCIAHGLAMQCRCIHWQQETMPPSQLSAVHALHQYLRPYVIAGHRQLCMQAPAAPAASQLFSARHMMLKQMLVGVGILDGKKTWLSIQGIPDYVVLESAATFVLAVLALAMLHTPASTINNQPPSLWLAFQSLLLTQLT